MLAYALYLAFVGAFIAVAALGHMLLFSAVYPNLFGAETDAGTEQAKLGERPSPRAPKIAA